MILYRALLKGSIASLFVALMPFVTATANFAHAGQMAALTSGEVSPAELQAMKGEYRRPSEIPFPEENPHSLAKAELGRNLFFDPRLSGSNLVSCGTCHNPSFGWEDGQPTAIGHNMVRLGRHTPTVLNLAWGEQFLWDGRADSLEQQALGPIKSAKVMSQPLDELLAELEAIPGYRPLFDAAFPGEGITADGIAKAIATYERTIVSNPAPFDLWIEGNELAISESAQRGFVLFNTKANCIACHSGWNFTDHSYQDIGLKTDDPGRSKQVGDLPELMHAFKTPGLRNIVERAPYMHDGSLKTLEEVVRHYANGFIKRPSLSPDMKPLDLSERDVEDLVAFLISLSSDDDPVALPILPNQRPVFMARTRNPASTAALGGEGSAGGTMARRYVLQVGSLVTAAGAEQEWTRLQEAFSNLLGGRELMVEQAEVRGRTYHRVQTGPFASLQSARDLCAQLKAKNQNCLVIRR